MGTARDCSRIKSSRFSRALKIMQSYQLTPLKHKILLGAHTVDKNIIRVVIYSAYEQQKSPFIAV